MFQPSLLQLCAPVERVELDGAAWVDIGRGWWADDTAPDDQPLLDRLIANVDWRAERRPMYDRIVDVPRLVAHYEHDETWPDSALREICGRLNATYAADLGEPLVSAGLCYYRDGNDSVAWHGDTIGRAKHADTVVAIVSLGSPRTFALRPHGGGPSQRIRVEHGDLLAMGGSCQRTWDHAIPKTARPVGPRISVQFRAAGVR